MSQGKFCSLVLIVWEKEVLLNILFIFTLKAEFDRNAEQLLCLNWVMLDEHQRKSGPELLEKSLDFSPLL